MRSIREVLRLSKQCGLSHRQIGNSVGISSSTVSDYLGRAKVAGLTWPLSDDLDDTTLDALLFPPQSSFPSARPEPDFAHVHRELKRKGVTKELLWQEYKEQCPTGFQYSSFCDKYKAWLGKINVTMRLNHLAGDKVFSDFAGAKLKITDKVTGEVTPAHIFVCALGASSYFFAEAFLDETTESWCAGHVAAFNYFGGSPTTIVPDNPKSAVNQPCRYEPQINAGFLDMASHYSCAVIPARVRRPKDKAKVESAVGVATRWILARLRNRDFHSLHELNVAVKELLEDANNRPFKKLPGSRKSAFEEIDKPALKPLPDRPFEYAEIRKARVGVDYHVEFEGHWYSCPYNLVRKEVELRVTRTTVEILHNHRRVASHSRDFHRGKHSTSDEHMPAAHREYMKWNPSRLITWAEQYGAASKQLIEAILDSKRHPEQGFRTCMGILRLAKEFGGARLNAACYRAFATRAWSYTSVKSILKTGLDRRPLPEDEGPVQLEIAQHANLRGASYFFIEENKNATSTNN
jgi:transposase